MVIDGEVGLLLIHHNHRGSLDRVGSRLGGVSVASTSDRCVDVLTHHRLLSP